MPAISTVPLRPHRSRHNTGAQLTLGAVSRHDQGRARSSSLWHAHPAAPHATGPRRRCRESLLHGGCWLDESRPSPGHQVTTVISSPPFTGSPVNMVTARHRLPRRRFASRSGRIWDEANRGGLQLSWVELDQVGLRVT